MSCRHLGALTARWDYLTHDGTCGTGWVACKECDTPLERLSVAGGRIRPQGRFVAAFQEQISQNGAFSDLRELETD